MTPAHSAELDITLDRDAEVPIGVQLTWALRTRIAGGTLPRGHRLPALHRLADDMGVNANTIRAVYAGLERDGLVETRHGSGTFVAGAAADHTALTQLAAATSRAARDAGIDPRDVAIALYVQTEDPVAPDPEAAARRRLRAQVAALEQAVTELTAGRASTTAAALAETAGAGADAGAGPPSGRPRLLTADDLRRQRTMLLHRLIAAQEEIDEDERTAADRAEPQKEPARARTRATAGATRPLPA